MYKAVRVCVCVYLCRALQVVRKVDILTPLGALYYNTGRYEEALQLYREAASLQPENQDIWLALVRALLNSLLILACKTSLSVLWNNHKLDLH